MRMLGVLILAAAAALPGAAGAGNVEEAKKEFESASDWLDKGEPKEALQAYNRAIELNPRYAEAYYARGRLYADTFKEHKKAFDDYSNCLKYDRKHVGALKARGDAYFYSKDYDAAYNDYHAALKAGGGNHYVYTQVGRIHMIQGDTRKAMKEFEQAIESWSGASDPHFHIGMIYLKEGKDDKALEEFSRAIEKNYKHGWAQNERGKIYLEREEYDNALKDFAQAINYVGSYNGAPHFNRGKTYLSIKEYDKAVRDFTSALNNQNGKYETAELYFDRALAWCYQGKFEEALPDAKKALEMEPNNLEYRRLHYNVELRVKRIQKIREKEQPENPDGDTGQEEEKEESPL